MLELLRVLVLLSVSVRLLVQLVLRLGLVLGLGLPLVRLGQASLFLWLFPFIRLRFLEGSLFFFFHVGAGHALVIRAGLVVPPLAITLGCWCALGHDLVLQGALGVGDVALGDVLGGQLLHRFVIVIHFALLVVLGGKSVFLIAMDVLPLNDLPNVEQLDWVVDPILELQVILPDLLEVNLKHRYELLRDIQFMLNSRQNGVLQDNVLDRVKVDRNFLAHLVLIEVRW